MQINSVPDNTRIQILGLEHLYKDLVVVNVNDCGALIRGLYRSNRNDPFSPIPKNYIIGCSTNVRVNGFLPEVEFPSNKEIKPVKTNPGANKRGFSLSYPSGEFTIRQLADHNGTSTANAYLKLKKEGKATVSRKVPNLRGKPTFFYILT